MCNIFVRYKYIKDMVHVLGNYFFYNIKLADILSKTQEEPAVSY